MKKSSILLGIILCVFVSLFQSCVDEDFEEIKQDPPIENSEIGENGEINDEP